ncbi:MAG TPA: FAD-dependent oxidoreductase, partial [Polyangiaceae bacterium]|nr:FAD-dependent oxidoreductase [Polyangiaceae bacterium]
MKEPPIEPSGESEPPMSTAHAPQPLQNGAAGRAPPATVLVVGNGMVSHRFCEKLREYDTTGKYRVVVVGEEPRPAYDRVHLTSYFTERSADALLLGTHAWYAEQGIDLRVGTKIVAVDRTTRVVTTAEGAAIPYDVLVLATGSAPFVPPVPGVEKRGV